MESKALVLANSFFFFFFYFYRVYGRVNQLLVTVLQKSSCAFFTPVNLAANSQLKTKEKHLQ